MPLVRRTRATLRSAEFGFLGVVVYTRVHTPRRWGLPLSAGVLVLPTLSSRPLRTSCWIVGTESPCSLALFSASFLSSSRACGGGASAAKGLGRPPRSGVSPTAPTTEPQLDVCGEVRRSGAPPARSSRTGAALARGTARGTPGTKNEATWAVLGASKRPFGRCADAAAGGRAPEGGGPPPPP